VTSLSQPCPNLINNYGNAVTRLTQILQCLGVSAFYTHHIDLLHYCLKCPAISNSLITQVLDLWLRESDGDIKPLLLFNCDKVVRRLLVSRLFIVYNIIIKLLFLIIFCKCFILKINEGTFQFLCFKKQNNNI